MPATIGGEIIAYDRERAFGFIVAQRGKRYFFHVSDLEGAAPFVRARVEFEPGRSRGRRHARHVRRVGARREEPDGRGEPTVAELRARARPGDAVIGGGEPELA